MSDKLTIARWSGSNGKSAVTITVENAEYTTIYRGDISLEDFAKCITGLSSCNIERDERMNFVFQFERKEGNA